MHSMGSFAQNSNFVRCVVRPFRLVQQIEIGNTQNINMGKRSKRKRQTVQDTSTAEASAIGIIGNELPQEYLDKYSVGIKAAAKEWKIQEATLQEGSKFVFKGKDTNRFGNRDIAKKPRRTTNAISSSFGVSASLLVTTEACSS